VLFRSHEVEGARQHLWSRNIGRNGLQPSGEALIANEETVEVENVK